MRAGDRTPDLVVFASALSPAELEIARFPLLAAVLSPSESALPLARTHSETLLLLCWLALPLTRTHSETLLLLCRLTKSPVLAATAGGLSVEKQVALYRALEVLAFVAQALP